MPSLRNTIIPQIGVSNFPQLHFGGNFFYFGVDSFQIWVFRFQILGFETSEWNTLPFVKLHN